MLHKDDGNMQENTTNDIDQTIIHESNIDSLDKIEVIEVIHQYSKSEFFDQNFDKLHLARDNSERFEAEKVAAMRSLKTNICLLASSCFFSLLIARSNVIFKSYLFSLMLKLVQVFLTCKL
jgi:hypothetical protein